MTTLNPGAMTDGGTSVPSSGSISKSPSALVTSSETTSSDNQSPQPTLREGWSTGS